MRACEEGSVVHIKSVIFVVTTVGIMLILVSLASCYSNISTSTEPTNQDFPDASIVSTPTNNSSLYLSEPEDAINEDVITEDAITEDVIETEEETAGSESRFDFDPIGTWVVVDSILARINKADPEKEPWPLFPISNGRLLVVTETSLIFGAYDGFDRGRDIVDFIFARHEPFNWSHFTMHSHLDWSAVIWFKNLLPHDTTSVSFFTNDRRLSYGFSDGVIYFIDPDTIIYDDILYYYLLERVCETNE